MFFLFRIITHLLLGNNTTNVKQQQKSLSNPSSTIVGANYWVDTAEFNLNVYLSDSPNRFNKTSEPVWSQTGLKYSWDQENERHETIKIAPPPQVLKNESMWAHVIFQRTDVDVGESRHLNFYSSLNSVYQMNRYVFRKVPKVKHSLLASSSSISDKTTDSNGGDLEMSLSSSSSSSLDFKEDYYASYWIPQLHVYLVKDDSVYSNAGQNIPPFLKGYYRFDYRTGRYKPPVYVSEFSLTRDKLILLNETVGELEIDLYYNSISLMKFSMQTQLAMSFKTQEQWGTSDEKESDEIKRIIQETNPYLLAVTVVVSLLHSLFDMLAFKNDISFWRKRKSMEGLSVRSLVLGCFFKLVIFLYLLDNETSWMIVISNGLGTAIEFWKVGKAMKISCIKKFPFLKFEDRNSYSSTTKKHDSTAMEYLRYAIYPLVVGYSIYKLVYSQFTSWYSWILSSLVGFIYAFGFVLMTPQLFINYKLKSVAHLPWRAMVYKSLNTFVDDLFAFVIKMPILHRIACFRDDLIFFIFLYQKWIYPVDLSRVNEYGFSAVDIDSNDVVATTTITTTSDRSNKQALIEDSNITKKDMKKKNSKNKRD